MQDCPAVLSAKQNQHSIMSSPILIVPEQETTQAMQGYCYDGCNGRVMFGRV